MDELTADEKVALAHLRGHCHDGAICPICRAFEQGRVYGAQEAITQVAAG